MRSQYETYTTYPLVFYWAIRLVFYFSLILAPAAALAWVVDLFPASFEATLNVLSYFVLPFAYAAIYEFLRRSGARSQKFIYLVAFMFATLAYKEVSVAVDTGAISRWFSFLICSINVAAALWVAFRGFKLNKRDEANAYHAAREEQIAMQTEAYVRAQAIIKERNPGG